MTFDEWYQTHWRWGSSTGEGEAERAWSSARKEPNRRIAELERENRKVTDRVVKLEASQRETFAAGWDAFFARHNGLIISHGLTDIRSGLEEAWQAYWQAKGQG